MRLKICGNNGYIDIETGTWFSISHDIVKQWLSEGNIPEPEFTDEELRTKFEDEFRQNRDSLLSTVVDHYQKPLVWETLTVEQQDKVRVYRQALLDSTTNWILPEELVI